MKTKNMVHPNNIMAKIIITVNSNGSVTVSGFPKNFRMAMDFMSAASYSVAQHFVSKARSGEVNDDLVIDESRIIKPKIVLN